MKAVGRHHARVHLTKVRPAEASSEGAPDGSAHSKYAASLSALEASAHVAVEDQVATQPEAPAQAPLSEGAVERNAMLRVTGGI